jgi:hypothetical protein
VTTAIEGAVDPLLEADRERFDPDRLCEEAQLITGLDDFGEADFREPLEVACRSAETEADLHVVGRARFREMVLRLLTGRLRILEYVRRDPGVLDEQIVAPVVVTGSPRSGTSILHQLLALHPDLRAPLSWEYFCPTPPPDPTCTDDLRIAIADRDLRMSGRLAPAFQGMHEMSATMTRECVAAQAFSLRTDDFWANFFLPTYQEYLIGADMKPAYDWHRLVLQILQRKAPGTRWVLKAPSHLATLPELFATFPDAELVVTHRDPLEVLSSVCSLLATLQWAHSTAIDFSRVVDLQLERNVELLERLVNWRAAQPDAQAFDVRYADYVADPLGTLVRLSDALGTPLPDAARSAMASYLDAHPQGRDGGHRHDVAALGIDPEVLRKRFARYEARFLQSGSTGSPA